MPDMKNVSQKLNGWRQKFTSTTCDTRQLIVMQRKLQQFFRQHSHGHNGKQFPDYKNLNSWTQKQKNYFTIINVLSIFDQVAQVYQWFKKMSVQTHVQDTQNLIFQLVDILHFIFNISVIWGIQDKIKPLQNFIPNIARSNQQCADISLGLHTKTSKILNQIYWKYWKNSHRVNVVSLVQSVDSLVSILVDLAFSLNYSVVDLHNMYMRKNEQNVLRQKQSRQYKN